MLAKEEGIVNAGCTVMVEKVLEMYPDGRMDILTRRAAALRDREPERGEGLPAGRSGVLR